MEVIDYSDRSIAVIGETKDIKEQLKELGGRWNPNLTINDTKAKGWIFSKNKEAAVRKLVGSAGKPKKEEESEGYQIVTYQVIKPIKGQVLYLYTYPNDDLKSSPESVEATVLKVYPNKEGIITKMDVSYEGSSKAVAIIIDGQWSLRYSDFPNYFDLE